MDEVSACMIKSNSTPLTLPFFLVLLCLFPWYQVNLRSIEKCMGCFTKEPSHPRRSRS
jgi:hypothetical protein